MTLLTTAIPTNEDDENETMEDIVPFWGNDEHDDEDLHDFLNTIKQMFIMKATITDAQQLQAFKLHLKSGATVEQWWEELPPSKKDNWDHFCQVFKVRLDGQ